MPHSLRHKKKNRNKRNKSKNKINVNQTLLVIFTGFLALIGWCQTRLVKQSMEKSNKAYISIHERPTVSYVENFRIQTQAFFRIKNTGQTPAYNVRNIATLVLAKNQNDAFQTIENEVPQKITEVMGANTVIPISPTLWINESNTQKIITKESTLFLVGKILYEDIFDETRFLEFCFFYDIDQVKFIYCVNYNEAN